MITGLENWRTAPCRVPCPEVDCDAGDHDQDANQPSSAMSDFGSVPADFGPSISRTDRHWLAVLLAGAVTTGGVLFGLWDLQPSNSYVLGWYAFNVFPIGAVGSGLLASTGFAIASLSTGSRLTGRLTPGPTTRRGAGLAAFMVQGGWRAQQLAGTLAPSPTAPGPRTLGPPKSTSTSSRRASPAPRPPTL